MFLSKLRQEWRDLATLLGLLRPEVPRLSVAALCMAAVALCTALYAFLAGPVLKSLFAGPSTAPEVPAPDLFAFLEGPLRQANALHVGAFVVAVASVKGLAFFSERMLVIGAGQRILHTLRARLYDGLLRQNPLSTACAPAGEYVSRFSVDAPTVEYAVTAGLMALLSNLLQVVSLAALCLSLSTELGLLGFIAFPPIAVLIARLGRLLRRRQGEFYDAYAHLAATLEETRGGLHVLQTFSAFAYGRRRFAADNESLRRHAVRASSIGAFSSPLNEVLGAAALGGTLYYAHQQIAAGELSGEAFVSFFSALFLLYRPVKGLGQAVHALQTGMAAMDRLSPLLTAPGVPAEPGSNAGLRVDNLEAGYNEDPSVLRGVTFSLAPGERACVVGTSGCGKTTLLQVIGGYLSPRAGTVERAFPVALVTQDTFLFDDSIAMNVRCGKEGATDAEVAAACDDAGVTAFATGMGGLDAPVGSKGGALSAGQRQRVCLARALLSDAKVVLLDEVTAALDGQTEALLIERLNTRLAGRTVLIVTHRESTARWAGRTLVLEGGRIVLDGPFDTLRQDQKVRALFGEETP